MKYSMPQKEGFSTTYADGTVLTGSWATRLRKWRELENESLQSHVKKLKTEHELPNVNLHDYNLGYVKAMNDVLNYIRTK